MGCACTLGSSTSSGVCVKVYSTGIVGESNYQDAIKETCAGERALICHEERNPHDKLALRVENAAGQIIGYIARSSWLRTAIHDEGRGCAATVKSVGQSEDGTMLGVVLDVTLTDDDLPIRRYGKAGAISKARKPVTPTAQPQDESDATLLRLIDAAVLPVTCRCEAVYRIGLAGVSRDTVFDCPVCKASSTLPDEVFDAVRGEFVSSAQALLGHSTDTAPEAPTLLAKLESAPRRRTELVSPVRGPNPSLWKRWFA